MIRWSEKLSGARGETHLAFTDRRGGVSARPYGGAPDDDGGLNLGGHVGDDPDAVRTNRERLAEALGLAPRRLVLLQQVHGREVVEVSAPWSGDAACADAMVTRTTDLALVVLVADCVPVLLADPDAGVVAVAHAGRPGMAAGVVPATVAAMRDLGADRPLAWLGASICPRCYEVPMELREQVAEVEPVSRSVTWDGGPAVDVAAGVLAQLARLGVPARQLPGCTVESPDLYSYRRDGATGRFAGVVRLSEVAA